MNLPLSPPEAADALLARRQARDSLIAFTDHTLPTYEAADHHHQIAEKLEAVERGDIQRLAIFMPPRHGKSELVSIRFPAWYIGRNPDKHVIAASYAQELASGFGRQVRNLLQTDEYRACFGSILEADSTAAHRWNTNRGGSYLAAGVGAGITGRGADILLIDDPVRSREDADSEVYRERTWEWYRGTAYTRLHPGGAIVLVQTRWHDDDLAGRILEGSRPGEWDVLELPALHDGSALWPAWYDTAALERIRDTIGPRDWSAQYQQQPAPDAGGYFQRDWVRYYDQLPDDTLAIYGASDYAVTDGGGDYTVHGVVGVDAQDNLYVLDWWKGQTASDEWVETVISMIDRWKPRKWVEEAGQIEKSIGPFLTKRMAERRVYCVREQLASSRDKATRARSIQARMSMGRVYFPRQAWGDDIVHEMLRFPAGAHDDQVDVLSLFGRVLDEMGRGRRQVIPEPPRGKTWDDIERDARRARLGYKSGSYAAQA